MVKGYLCYKIIFCHKLALDIQLMIFLFEEKIMFFFSGYLDFCVFVKSTDVKICYIIISIATYWALHLRSFLVNPKYYHN